MTRPVMFPSDDMCMSVSHIACYKAAAESVPHLNGNIAMQYMGASVDVSTHFAASMNAT